MPNADTERLVEEVESQTGYKVCVGTTDVESADAVMISAQPGHPVHVINVAKHSLPYADYVIASQCMMLMNIWSHPKGIPQFTTNEARLKESVESAASWTGLAKLPKDVAASMGRMLVEGLLHQLRSGVPPI